MQMRFDLIDGKNALRLRFAEGEMLEMHEHDPCNYHDVAVASGRAAVYGEGWRKEVKAGEILFLTDDEMRHEIAALEPNTEVLNVYRLPMPNHASKIGMGWLSA